MTFRQRLMYYAIGVGLGIVGVSFFFKDRGCEWTPGNRVMFNISASQMMISDSMRCILKSNKIHDDDIFEIFKDGGVNFKESNPQANPKWYILKGHKAIDEKEFKLKFIVRSDTLTEIVELIDNKISNCNNLSAASDKIFIMPERTVKKILKTKDVITSDSLKIQIKNLKLGEGQVINMIQFGKIDFAKSRPLEKPNAIYFIHYQKYILSIELAQDRAYLLTLDVK